MAASGASLLALVLVAETSLGPSIVYAYPPSPQAVPRSSKPVYPSLKHDDASTESAAESDDDDDSDSDSNSDSDGVPSVAEIHLTGSPSTPSSAVQRLLSSYLGFTRPVLASLLCPSRELCDQAFELVVDHLAFVGHPVWVGEDDPPAPGRLPDDANVGETDEQRGRSRRRRSQQPLPNTPPSDTEGPATPSSRPSSAPPSASKATPIQLPPESPSTTPALSSLTSSLQSQTSSINGASSVTSFNFVVVVDTPPDSHLSSHLEAYYKDVVVPITANLKALERKDRWLGKEAGRLRKARERYAAKGQTPLQYLHSLPSISPLAAALSSLFHALKASLMANITLGPLPVQVLLRGELPVSLSSEDLNLPPPEPPSAPADENIEQHRSPSPVVAPVQKQRPPLFSRMRVRPPVRIHPWETLLLLEDVATLKRDVTDGSFLWRFLEICDPTLSFAEYEILLDLDAEQSTLQEIADHLVRWNKARVIDVVSLNGVYALATEFEPSRLAQLCPAFSSQFPTLPPLPLLLARVSPTEPVLTLVPVPSLRSLYVSALVFLLRNEVLVKLRSYIRLVASLEIKQAARSHWAATGDHDSSGFSGHSTSAGEGTRSRTLSQRSDIDDARAMAIVGSAISASPPLAALSRSHQSTRLRTLRTQGGRSNSGSATTLSSASERIGDDDMKNPSVIVEPGRPSAAESRWIIEMCRDKEKSVVEKFERMIRLLNGQHHLDEIRHRATLSRREIRLVLSAFSEHIIVFLHP